MKTYDDYNKESVQISDKDVNCASCGYTVVARSVMYKAKDSDEYLCCSCMNVLRNKAKGDDK